MEIQLFFKGCNNLHRGEELLCKNFIETVFYPLISDKVTLKYGHFDEDVKDFYKMYETLFKSRTEGLLLAVLEVLNSQNYSQGLELVSRGF